MVWSVAPEERAAGQAVELDDVESGESKAGGLTRERLDDSRFSLQNINPSLLPTAFMELDYSCISTAATLVEGLKLQAGYRVGGSRKRLFESWFVASPASLGRSGAGITFSTLYRFSLLHHHLLQALRSKPLALTTRQSGLVSPPSLYIFPTRSDTLIIFILIVEEPFRLP